MKPLTIVIVILLVLALGACIYYLLFLNDDTAIFNHNANNNGTGNNSVNANNDTETDACLALNCSLGTMYVGSVNSDKYYTCSCRYAKNINPENIVCFSSDAEAQSAGYTKTQC
jgi:flagellar basal body-associated protein FliL